MLDRNKGLSGVDWSMAPGAKARKEAISFPELRVLVRGWGAQFTRVGT